MRYVTVGGLKIVTIDSSCLSTTDLGYSGGYWCANAWPATQAIPLCIILLVMTKNKYITEQAVGGDQRKFSENIYRNEII